MSISYQSKDSAVLGLQLKVQELCVKLADSQVVSVSGSDATIDVKEVLADVRCAIHCDDSAAAPEDGVLLVSKASISYPDSVDPVTGLPTPSVPGGKRVTLALSAALAADDSIILKYVIAE